MAAWIGVGEVAALLQTDLTPDDYAAALVEQAQGLAEVEVGLQETPSAGLKAVLAQIVARMWQAGQNARANPAGFQGQTVGPFGFQSTNAGAAGLGLTDREKRALRKAAGLGGLWIQPTSRATHLETPGACAGDELADTIDPVEQLAAAQADMPRPR